MTAMMMQVRMAAMLMLQMLRFKVGPDPVITNYREVNVVSLVGTGAVKSKICTHAKFRKYAQNIGWALFLSTLLFLRKSAVFYCSGTTILYSQLVYTC